WQRSFSRPDCLTRRGQRCCMAVELPDEAIAYNYQGLLVPVGEPWSPAAEMRLEHFLSPARLKEIAPRVMQAKSQVAADREMRLTPPELAPLEPGFIDLPQNTLDNHRRKGDASELGRILTLAARLKDETGRIVLLGAGGAILPARTLFQALKPAYHNE